MSTHISVSSHDGLPHAIDSVIYDLDYILQQDAMYNWLSHEERIKLIEVKDLLGDLGRR